MLCSNYRPISFLAIVSKIIEKLIHESLTLFLERYHILNKNQCGFLRSKLTDHGIFDVHTKAIKVSENREKSCSIFLDPAKVFGPNKHEIIHKKLKYYGLHGLLLNWFKPYLSGRHLCVNLINAKSHNKAIALSAIANQA